LRAMVLDRITRNPAVMGGKPCVRGMRVTVAMIVGLVASGHTTAEILTAYPYIEEEDIRQALPTQRGAWKSSRFPFRQYEAPDMNLRPLAGFLAASGSSRGGLVAGARSVNVSSRSNL